MGVFKYDFDKIAREAIKKYAKKNHRAENIVRIMMYLDEGGNDCYAIYLDSEFSEKVRILDILNKKIDFTGESLIISHFVKQELKKLSDQNDIDKSKVRMLILLSASNKVLLYLLNGNLAVKVLNPDEILSDEKFAEVSNDIIKQIEQ